MPKKVATEPKKNVQSKKIVMAAAMQGASLKNAVKAHLLSEGYEIIDLGTDSDEHFVSYGETSSKLARAIQKGVADKGIVFCGTGMGVAITANKFKGIYCGLVESEFTAGQCKLVNNCNVLAMGTTVISEAKAKIAVDRWLTNEFAAGTTESVRKLLTEGLEELAKIEDENGLKLTV